MFAMLVLQEVGPNTELGWLFYLFLGFFLLMVIVGWLTNRRGGNQAEAMPEMHVHPHEHAAMDEHARDEGGDHSA